MSHNLDDASAEALAQDESDAASAATDPTSAPADMEEYDDDDDDEESFPFTPVQLRFRRDGWTPGRQEDFIRALAETACVESACRQVGLSCTSAYKLRANPDAQSFRIAWESALDLGVSRLSDAALSRAIYGVPIPHFHNGEQVGEHRRYDERLAMFLLRTRDPTRFGRHIEKTVYPDEHDVFAVVLEEAILCQRQGALDPDELILAQHLARMRARIAEAVEELTGGVTPP